LAAHRRNHPSCHASALRMSLVAAKVARPMPKRYRGIRI
jgi:hypothetical protein